VGDERLSVHLAVDGRGPATAERSGVNRGRRKYLLRVVPSGAGGIAAIREQVDTGGRGRRHGGRDREQQQSGHDGEGKDEHRDANGSHDMDASAGRLLTYVSTGIISTR